MSGYEVRSKQHWSGVGYVVRVVEPRLIQRTKKTKLRRWVLFKSQIDAAGEELLDKARAQGKAQKNLKAEFKRKHRQRKRRRSAARRRWVKRQLGIAGHTVRTHLEWEVTP